METPNRVKFCPSCGDSVRADARFCVQCGRALDLAAVASASVGDGTASNAIAYTQPPPGPPSPALPGYVRPATPPGAKAPINGLAIASMVLGIIWIYWIGSILALVFGYIAKNQIKDSNSAQSGDGMATAGIVLGWVGVGVLVLLLFLAAVHSSTQP